MYEHEEHELITAKDHIDVAMAELWTGNSGVTLLEICRAESVLAQLRVTLLERFIPPFLAKQRIEDGS